jgi:hypothetical protein
MAQLLKNLGDFKVLKTTVGRPEDFFGFFSSRWERF